MRAILTAFLAIGLITSPYASVPKTPPPSSVLEKLSGVWDTMPEGQPLCKNDDYHHTISVSPDRQRITFKHKKPIKGPKGNLISEYSYKVLYSTDNSITMFLDGETRSIETGDLIIWVFMLDAKNIYRWRIYGSHPHSRNSVVGMRCGA